MKRAISSDARKGRKKENNLRCYARHFKPAFVREVAKWIDDVIGVWLFFSWCCLFNPLIYIHYLSATLLYLILFGFNTVPGLKRLQRQLHVLHISDIFINFKAQRHFSWNFSRSHRMFRFNVNSKESSRLPSPTHVGCLSTYPLVYVYNHFTMFI